MSSPLPLFALFAVAACAPVAPQDPPPQDASQNMSKKAADADAEPQIRVGPGLDGPACDASRVQDYVGRIADADSVRDAVAASGARTVRVIKPGMAVTMDFRGDRLNLRLDADDRIVAVTCG